MLKKETFDLLDAYPQPAGTSDLDDEQPINVSMTLGDYRRIQRIVWKGEGR